MTPIIEFKDYTFKYRSQVEPTLRHVNLTINAGEKVLIVGPSGSGKSTLAHCINGLVPFSFPGESTGSLTVSGKDPAKEGIFGMSKLVGTVLQDTDGQFIGLTVAEDIAFALENDCVPQEELFQRVDEVAETVDVKFLLDHAPTELSGGQKQRVSMAGVMIDDVDILLFDEPLANLDPATGKRAIDLIDKISKTTGKTVLIIEHRLEDALYRDVDRIVVVGEGEIVADMKPDELLCTDVLEKEGIRVNGEELKEYGEKLQVRIEELEKTIWEEAGEEFNINSPKQLGVILFEKMKLPGGKKTKTGYSTAADVLDKLAPDHQIVADILEYRQLAKLKSTYADGLAAYIGEDERIHTTFQQTITATGRLSSVEPNLQNIPIRMELGRRIRKVFIPAEGTILVDADYSQIELRVLAHMSGDEHLIQAYREAQDIHRLTASQVFHVPFDEVTPLQRRNAKAVNFGIVYGISSFGLSQDLSITRKEAQEYIQKYFETYPKIKEFLDGCVEKAKQEGYAETMFGRRRPVPELKSSNFMQRSFGERVAMNAPIQGTAADIIKIAMNRVDRRLRAEGLKSRLLLQVHDELLVEAETGELSRVKEILAEEMQGAAELSVPLEIDMKQGMNWYEAH